MFERADADKWDGQMRVCLLMMIWGRGIVGCVSFQFETLVLMIEIWMKMEERDAEGTDPEDEEGKKHKRKDPKEQG